MRNISCDSLLSEIKSLDKRSWSYYGDSDGYLNVGRETGDEARTVYFACNAFRKVSLVMKVICDKYQGSIKIDYDIFKDKYWRSLSHFMN